MPPRPVALAWMLNAGSWMLLPCLAEILSASAVRFGSSWDLLNSLPNSSASVMWMLQRLWPYFASLRRRQRRRCVRQIHASSSPRARPARSVWMLLKVSHGGTLIRHGSTHCAVGQSWQQRQLPLPSVISAGGLARHSLLSDVLTYANTVVQRVMHWSDPPSTSAADTVPAMAARTFVITQCQQQQA